MARATSSLPVPDSPVTSTVLLVLAIVSIIWNTASMRVAAADDVGELVTRVQRALEQHVLLLQPARLEMLPDLQPQLVHAERLREVVDGPEPHRLDRGLGRGEGGHHEGDDVAIQLLGDLQHLDAAHVGHPDVREQQIDALALQHLDRRAAVLGHEHVVAVAPQHDPKHVAQRRLVVDDQDARLTWRRAGGTGSAGAARAVAARLMPSSAARSDRRIAPLRQAETGATGSRTLTVVPYRPGPSDTWMWPP